MDVLKEIWVAANSDIHKVSATINKSLKTNGSLTIKVIGAGAINQAVKSLAKSKENLEKESIDFVIRTSFGTINDERKTVCIIFYCTMVTI